MPSVIDRALYRMNRVNYSLRRTKLMRAKPVRGVVSFTFDDFPRSAFHCGGDILRCHGVRGTYYASMGLEGRTTEVGESFVRKDVEDLLERRARTRVPHLFARGLPGIELGRTGERAAEECGQREGNLAFLLFDDVRLSVRRRNRPGQGAAWPTVRCCAKRRGRIEHRFDRPRPASRREDV